jgi:putative ABC transport system permease protein
MRSPRILAWSQLTRDRPRFLMAVAGVGFAVVLMLMQLGFRRALFASAVRFHRAFAAEVFVIDPRTAVMIEITSFPRVRLLQALGQPGVESVSAVYLRPLPWTNLRTGRTKNIDVMGIDPRAGAIDLPGVREHTARLSLPDTVLFDAASRPEFGPIAEELRSGLEPRVEVAHRRVEVAGVFELGTSFGVDGTILTSDLNFLRLLPDRPPGLIDIGLVKLATGANPAVVRDQLARALPPDVLVLTKDDFMRREMTYWDTVTPIGYVFGFGVVVGFAVGSVLVAQILFSDVSDQIDAYATLKAMGFDNRYLYAVVLYEAVFLAGIGYLPGLAVSSVLYRLAASATGLPLVFEWRLAALVLGLTFAMCCLAGALALRKLETADPAEIFR